MTKIQDSPATDNDKTATDQSTDLDGSTEQSIVSYRTSDSTSLPSQSTQDDWESGLVVLEPLSPDQFDSVGVQQEQVTQTRFERYAVRDDDVETSINDTPSGKRLLASLALVASIIGLSVFGGFMLGQGTQRLDLITILPASFSPAGAGSANSVPVSSAQTRAVEAEMNRQLGDMRAELLRLHSVFAHLAKLAELEEGEFDLKSPLLDWKDQSSVERLGLLNRRIGHISDSSDTLMSIFDTRRIAYDQKISGSPIVEGSKSSGFGYRTDPLSGERVEHLGQDYSGAVGEPILALADGVVTYSGKNAGYGNLVELEHIDGFRTRYAHNQANLVKRGAWIRKGEPIATLGSTGRSTGPHVHVEVRLDGQAIDPSFFLR